MTQRSPITQPGGKYYSVKHILPAFPHQSAYKTYVEVFCGSGVMLLNKPTHDHLETINDANGDLINFWKQCRSHPKDLQEQIDSILYSRQLYEEYQASLFDGSVMSDMERAVRWFFVLRSSIGGKLERSKGNWGYGIKLNGDSIVSKYRSACQLLTEMSVRLRYVQIEHHDFEHIITTYERPTTFFYCDPPYVDVEAYYEGAPLFTEQDHHRLANLLNATPAMVALSYYPHPLVDELYPAHKWRRITWSVYKSVEKTTETRQKAQELLLMNYPAHVTTQSLWTPDSVLETSDTELVAS